MQSKRPGRGAARRYVVVKVPVEHKGLAESMQSLVDTTAAAARSSSGGRAVDYAETERAIAERTAAVERAAHAEVLRSLDVDAPRIRVRGVVCNRIGREPGTYFSMAGDIVTERTVYRPAGVRNGPIVDPIALRSGAYGRGWLPLTAQCMANDVQRGPSREAADAARQSGRFPYSRASFERVAHLVGEHWLREHADIEDQLTQEFEVPTQAAAMSVALDRVSVPMEEPRKRPVGRPRKDAPERPVERNFRMAYCATITLHDAEGESLHTLRYGCMPEGDVDLWCAEIAGEAHRLLVKRPALRIKLLSDGAPEMCNLLQSHFPAAVFGKVEQGIDFWHVIEKLAPAAEVIFGVDHAKPELHRWRARLRTANCAAEEILAELRDSGLENKRRDSKRPVHEAITYFENHAERMRFATSLRSGLPIGSGAVEATAKTLVGVRMKRAGSRWKTATGEHIIRLRALALSNRWQPAMQKLHATRRAAVKVAA
jgi:hypothetical protein